MGRCYPKKSQVSPYKNLGRFYRAPVKSLLRVQTIRATDFMNYFEFTEYHSSTDMYLLDKNKQTSFLMMMHASIDTMAPNCWWLIGRLLYLNTVTKEKRRQLGTYITTVESQGHLSKQAWHVIMFKMVKGNINVSGVPSLDCYIMFHIIADTT